MDSAVYAYTQSDYEVAMDKLKKESEKAYEWLSKIGKEHFSRHAFNPSKTDLVVNNLSEVLNSSILKFRDKPIVTMIECIRSKEMAKRSEKRSGAANVGWVITPIISEKLELEKRNARYCRPICAGVNLWQVSCAERTYEVNLTTRTCGCFKWDLTGVPCKHACSAIFKARQHPEDFVHEWFKKEQYMRAYEDIIYPVPGERDWSKTDTPDIDPPKFTRHPGCPKKCRMKGSDEKPIFSGRARMTTITCSNCGRQGHRYLNCALKLRPDLEIRKRKHMPAPSFEEDRSFQPPMPPTSSTATMNTTSTKRARSGGGRGRGQGRASGRRNGTGMSRAAWLLFGQKE